MLRRALFPTALLSTALCACATRPAAVPPNVAFGARPPRLTSPRSASSGAPPRILSVWFSSDVAERGRPWSGRIVTTTNVASVEVRTNLFSVNVPRHSFGRFAFMLRVLDVPPIFVRAYRLRIIARNAAGVQAEEDLPFRIR